MNRAGWLSLGVAGSWFGVRSQCRGRGGWLPGWLRRRRARMLLGIGALAVVVVLSVGVVLGSLLGGSAGSGPTSITLAATAADEASGATLSVSVSSQRDGVAVRAS